jgi:hypothetical protein
MKQFFNLIQVPRVRKVNIFTFFDKAISDSFYLKKNQNNDFITVNRHNFVTSEIMQAQKTYFRFCDAFSFLNRYFQRSNNSTVPVKNIQRFHK